MAVLVQRCSTEVKPEFQILVFYKDSSYHVQGVGPEVSMKYFFCLRYQQRFGYTNYLCVVVFKCFIGIDELTTCIFQVLFLDGTNSELALLPNAYLQNKKNKF